jgi:hypothetical protein
VFARPSQAVCHFIRSDEYPPYLIAIVEVRCVAVPANAVYTVAVVAEVISIWHVGAVIEQSGDSDQHYRVKTT